MSSPRLEPTTIVAEVRAAAAAQRERDLADPRVLRAERHQVGTLTPPDASFAYVAACLRYAAWVDTRDFPIEDRRRGIRGRVFARTKGWVWKILRFATDRLWSQQNRINREIVDVLLEGWRSTDAELRRLEARVRELEAGASAR